MFKIDMEYKLRRKTSLQMLWVAIISMIMVFAGLTSAYIISTKREDWISFNLPSAFYISSVLIIVSSISFILAKRAIKKGEKTQTSLFLGTSLLLGIAFIVSQFYGFKELIAAGLYFTGAQSNIATSFLYVITVTHLVHVMAAVLVLIFIVVKQFKGGYTPENYIGIELGSLFWHFLDALWIYLFLFFYFIR
ncbi:MAG: cytochrome oxidase subunit III [Flavobacteriaceae bacterium CG1_02_35_72]|nr:MAG: cytochrome oxidase subunit III [Flavobacteriaceae bacterium CG1_02_35_72]